MFTAETKEPSISRKSSKVPLYLKEIAHIFADPLLENTGLEGGHLDSSLKLMQDLIEKLFYAKFPGHKTKLEQICYIIKNCQYYVKLLKEDKTQSTQKALQKISEDIKNLSDRQFLLIPGGWQGRTKPGHAMLYLITPNKEFIVINTGSGSGYHAKEAKPNLIQGHFLSLILKDKQDLIKTGVLERLLTLQTKPADYYRSELLYEVILPLIAGEIKIKNEQQHAYDLQLAGTCFWQCVEKLLFYFYKDEQSTFELFRQCWQKNLLAKVHNELQDKIKDQGLSVQDLQSAPWETYFQLIIFSIRYYCSNPIGGDPNEQHEFYFQLKELQQFSEINLAKPHKIRFVPKVIDLQAWKIDSQFAVFNEYSNGNNISLYFPVSKSDGFSLVKYCKNMDWQNRAQIINAHLGIESFLLNLPLSESFISNEMNLIPAMHALLTYYYRLQSTLYPNPSPEVYAKQLVAGFSGFCFVDKIIRPFIPHYVPALSHLSHKTTLLNNFSDFIVTSPKLSQQLQEIILYLKKLENLKVIFNFIGLGISIADNSSGADVEFLNESKNISYLNNYRLELPFTERIAYAIIDKEKQFFPNEIHCWREIGLLCRFLLSNYIPNENILSESFWGLGITTYKGTNIKLNLYGFKNMDVVFWEKYAVQTVCDPAAKWLCDTPQAELKENEILIQAMPESKIMNRRLFNQLAEIRVSPNLQIFSILEFMIQHVHQFRYEDFQYLFEKYLFSIGQNLADEGSLLFKESQQQHIVKSLLLKFMNISEYYFSGKSQDILTYLNLIRHFIRIENFLLPHSQALICCMIYEKLSNFLAHQNKYKGEIAAHLILLYQNAFLLPNSLTPIIIERLVICWAHLLRERQLQKNFPESLFIDAKKVLLSLQSAIDASLNNPLLNIFFQILFAIPNAVSKSWVKIDMGCLQSEDYFINIFDGKMYYKGFQIGRLPEEITQHEDYIHLFGKNSLAIELLQANSQISVYRSLGGERAHLLTLYRYPHPSSQTIEQNFQTRQYGNAHYYEYIYADNIHKSYFSPELFDTELNAVQSRVAKKRIRTNTLDVIIHEELSLGDKRFTGQFLPRWRLEGLLPCALLDKYLYFVGVDSNQDKTIYILDANRQCHYLLSLFKNNQLKLVNVQGAEWIDLVRLSKNSPLAPFCEGLCLFELPNYILAFQYPDNTILVELVRHQLKFRYNPQNQCLESLNYNNFYLSLTQAKHLKNIEYQLILQNNINETIIIFPYLVNIKQGFLRDDPLNGKIYSDLYQLGSPGFFAYHYSDELEKLTAESLEAELYLIMLYAKTRDYLSAFYHLRYCWQDQILTSKEWVLFKKFFDETKDNCHPDMHACRLLVFLLYLPIYTLIYDRKAAKDILDDSEEKQLSEYGVLFEAMLKEYEIYLSKWTYVHHKLQLTRKQEGIFLDAIGKWNFVKSQIVRNRETSIKYSDNAKLLTPTYPYNDPFKWATEKITFSSNTAILSLGNKPVDIFGYNEEQPVPIADCFLFLYSKYKACEMNSYQLRIILHSLVWANKLQPYMSDFVLFQYLLKVSFIPVYELPSLFLMPTGNKIIFYLFINYSDEDKLAAAWFKNLKLYLEKKIVSYTNLKTTDLSVNLLHGKSTHLNCYTSKPNTLPINPPNDNFKKMELYFNQEIFFQRYYFYPHQPLGDLFSRYFIRKEEKPIRRPFPLEKSKGEIAGYMYEFFQRDFDYFQTLPNDIYSAKNNFTLYQDLIKDCNNFIIKLNKAIQNVKSELLELANKNKSIEISYAQLAGKRTEFILDDLLFYLIIQQREKYFEQNSFLTEEDVGKLATLTINYLVLNNRMGLIKKINSLLNNLKTSTYEKEKENIIAQIGKLCYQKRYYDIPEKILFLFLEYLTGSLLWELQVKTLEISMPAKKNQAIQLFLGGGKSSTVAPLLGCLFADGNQLMTYTIPNALVAQFVQVLRQRLRGPLFKRVHTFHLARNSLLTPNVVKGYLDKLREIKINKDVLVITPEVPNCILLKWLELSKEVYSGNRTNAETVAQLENILCFLGATGIQLIDELDSVLAPLKSELNFTEGEAKSLTPARWDFAQQLLLATLKNETLQPIIQQAIKDHHCKPHGDTQIFPQGMLELINIDFYHQALKPAIAKLILDSHKIKYPIVMFAYLLTDPGKMVDNAILLPVDLIDALNIFDHYTYSQKEKLITLNSLLENIEKVENRSLYKICNSRLYLRTIHPLLASLICAHVDLLRKEKENELVLDYFIMAKEWLQEFLPYVLQKRLNIDYGRYFEIVVDAKLNTTKKYFTSKKLAVPYYGKDSPSKRSEFQHPDIIIAFTWLQYFYDGLHFDEFIELISNLQSSMEKQTSKELSTRDAVVLFRQWQADAKLALIELNHIDLTAPWQLAALHQGLYRHTKVISYYLNHFVFLQHLKIYPQKNSSNGFDLSSLIFRTTKGITGMLDNQLYLPENLIPHHQKGTDGSMLYILTMPNNQRTITVDFKDDIELLKAIDFKKFKMFTDAGGLIQNTSNNDVARILLSYAPENILGIIFVDDLSQRLQILTRAGFVQSVSECGIPPQYLFKYIDHSHRRGIDMPQYMTDCGLITLSPQMTLSETFQGSKRLRLLDIYQNQSIFFLLRQSDAKQIIKNLNLANSTVLTSQHILQWSFNHSLKQIAEELQLATYHGLYAVTRLRAYHLLLGKFSISKVNKELLDELRENGILDEYDRVSREVTLTMLQSINTDNKQALVRRLNNIYRYRQKDKNMEIVGVCFNAFRDCVNYDITQMLPMSTCEDTKEILSQQKDILSVGFYEILTEEDNEKMQSIIARAEQFLPEWVIMKPFNQQIECERQQLAEKQNENQQQQEQHKQSQQHTFFKPVSEIIWNYNELLTKSIKQLTVSTEKLKLQSNDFRILTLASIMSLPFVPQLLVSENFLRTEINSYTLSHWAKNIFYYLEVQEKSTENSHRYFILISVKEAGYFRYCLEKNYFLSNQKSFGLRTLMGTITNISKDFVIMDAPELFEVQLHFLNGATENEIPSRLHATWKTWIETCNPQAVQEKQQQLRTALRIS